MVKKDKKTEPFPEEWLQKLRFLMQEREIDVTDVKPAEYQADLVPMLIGYSPMQPNHLRALVDALSPLNKATRYKDDLPWLKEVLGWAARQDAHKTKQHYQQEAIELRHTTPPQEIAAALEIHPEPLPVAPKEQPGSYGQLREQFISSFAHATTASAVLNEFGLQRNGKATGRFSPADKDKVGQKLEWLMKNGAPEAGVSLKEIQTIFKGMSALETPSAQRSSESYRTMLTTEYVEARKRYLNLFHPIGARKADAKLAKFGLLPGDVAGPFDGVKPEINEIQQKNVPLLSQAKASQMLDEVLKAAHRLRHEAQSQERLR